eukprot:gene16814-23015_t
MKRHIVLLISVLLSLNIIKAYRIVASPVKVVKVQLTTFDLEIPVKVINHISDVSTIALTNDINGDSQAGLAHMMKYINFVSEEWTHVLAWDLFVGQWIWMDGIKRNILTVHSVLLTYLIGPPGLLSHFLTCAISRKELPT